MTSEHEMTAMLNLEIPNPALAQSLLRDWAGSGVQVDLLRGRVTAEDARFELQVRGSKADVASILRKSIPWRKYSHPRREARVEALA